MKTECGLLRLRGKGRLTENDVREAMREVRLALLEADVSYKVVKEFVATVTERSVGTDADSLTPAQQVVKIVNEELTNLMGGGTAKLSLANNGPTIVMMVARRAPVRPPPPPSWRAICEEAAQQAAAACRLRCTVPLLLNS